MLLRILTALEVSLGSRDAYLGGPKQRMVLALLALRANRPVGVDELVDDLWGDGTPSRPRKTLQVYIANLRRELDAPSRIVSEPFGYRLVLADDEFDLHRFHQLTASARAVVNVDPVRAAGRYREALRLWPGQPLPDLQSCPAIARLTRPLDNLRAEVAEEFLALEVRSGRSAAAVPALLELTASGPWRERPWVLLMEAYYRSGRQKDALDTYQRVRALLADELGVEPGAELRRMERRILVQDPALVVAAPDSVTVAVADERRPATFASFGIADYSQLAGGVDPEDLVALVEVFRRGVREVVDRYGGVVHSLDEDRVLACFGHPRAGEDDPHQAVRAALAAVRDGACGEGVRVCAGVHTGLAFFRTATSPAAFGNTPASAGRLQRDAAPGEVRVCAETAALIGARFAVSRVGTTPGAPFAVSGELAVSVDAIDHGRLRGRTRELRMIRQAVGARTGPAVVLLCGEAGIGKTSLAGSALAELDDTRPGGRTTVLRADRHRRDQALHPVAAALAARYRDAGELALELGVLGVPAGTRAQIVPVLGELAGWPNASGRRSTRATRCGAVVSWLAAGSLAAGSGEVRLVVEDLHDADDETLAVLDVLMDELTGGVLLVTSRTDDLPPRLSAVATRVPVCRLRPSDARGLVIDAAGARRLRTATVNQIVRSCDGHPLHLRELTLATVAAGRGRVGAGAPPPATRAELPAALQTSLLARLDRLGPAKALALRCAVVGGPFDRRLAALLSDGHGAEGPDWALLDQELTELVEAGVLRHLDHHGGTRFVYGHALLEDSAYASLSRSVRRDLHRRVADWMGCRSRPDPARLAGHLEAAGEVVAAAGHWIQAAQQATVTARFLDGSTFARRALNLLPHLKPGADRDQLDLMANLLLAGSLKMTVSSDSELHAAVLRAWELAVALGRTDLLVHVYAVLISSLHGLGRYEEAIGHGEQGLIVAASVGDPVFARIVRQFHCATLIWSGRLSEASALFDPVADGLAPSTLLPGASPAATTVGICAGLSIAGLAAFSEDRPEHCERLYERANAVARQAPAPDSICLTDITYAISRQLAGDVAATHRLAESTLESTIALGSDWWFIWAQVLLGWAVSAGGNPHEGVAMMAEAIDHAGEVRQLLPYFGALLAEGELAAGRPAEALRRARAAVTLAERTGERFFLPYLHLVVADALAANGRPAAELATARRRAHDLAVEQGQRWFARRAAPLTAVPA